MIIKREDEILLSSPQPFLIYRGKSMFPTFRNYDILYYEPYHDQTPRKGDVIAFQSSEQNIVIIHRIIKISSFGIITKGDNNSTPDSQILDPTLIIGRVCACRRNIRKWSVKGGIHGQLSACNYHMQKILRQILFHLGRPFYHKFVKMKYISRWTTQLMDLQISSYTRGNSLGYKLKYRNRIIGVLPPGKPQWSIVFPYLLLIDPDQICMSRMNEYLPECRENTIA